MTEASEFTAGLLARNLLCATCRFSLFRSKAPKVYWRDSGLAHALLGIGAERQLLEQPWVGASFECHVIEQIIGQVEALGLRAQPYFLRTHDGHEIDLVLEIGGSRWAIECKLSTQPDRRDLKRIVPLADAIGAERRILLSRSSQLIESSEGIACNLSWLLENLNRLITTRNRHRS